MANTKLRTVAPFVSAEKLTSKFAASATLSTAGATIPTNTAGVWMYVSAAAHWNPAGSVTATTGHALYATSWVYVPTAKVGTAQFIGDAGAIDVVIVYERGSRPSLLHSMTAPY